MKVEKASDRSDDSGSDSSSCSSSDVESSSTDSNISSFPQIDCSNGTDWLMGDFAQENESMDVDVMGNVGGDVVSEIWKDRPSSLISHGWKSPP
jgi:hypothetical protein